MYVNQMAISQDKQTAIFHWRSIIKHDVVCYLLVSLLVEQLAQIVQAAGD